MKKTKKDRKEIYEELIKLRIRVKNELEKAQNDYRNDVRYCADRYASPFSEAKILVWEDFIEIFDEICFWFITKQSPLENTQKLLERLNEELMETKNEKEVSAINNHLSFLNGRAKALESAIGYTEKVVKLFEELEG